MCIDGFKHCRPLLFLDEMFLKGRFKGNLLAAIVKDGNQGNFTVSICFKNKIAKINLPILFFPLIRLAWN